MDTLFDDRQFWGNNPAAAFGGFVMSPQFLALSKRKPSQRDANGIPLPPMPLRHSSAKIYCAMFAAFVRWLEAQRKSVFDVSSDDLMAFLQEGGARRSRIRVQYLGLLERVFTHLGMQPNPAVHVCFSVFRSGNQAVLGTNVEKAVLTEAQEATFMAALPEAKGWKRRRDRAMQALMLGAGVKVSEAVGMYVENIGAEEAGGSMQVTISPAAAGGTVRWHQTPLRPFAVQEVLQWVEERKALNIPGPLLFPASLQGGRLHAATVYRQVRATFLRAGIDVARQGGRTLRNAFAVRELKASEHDVEKVGEFLGHRKQRAMEPYSKAAKEMT